MWLLVPYARDRRWAGRQAQGRYCIADDAAQDGWREVEILGGYAIVVATAAAGSAINALPGVQRLPPGMTLADTLGELTLAERRALRDVALSLGYDIAELRAQFGQQVDLSTVRLATFLNFLRQRRRKARYDPELDEVILDGAVQACEQLPIDVLNAFPTTAVLDDFNRANSASLGTSYAGSIFGGTALRIVSNQCGPSADSGNQYSGAIYRYSSTPSPQTYGPDCEGWYTIAAVGASAEGGFEILLRADVSITPDCYSFFGNHGTGSTCSINRYDNGSFTQLGASLTQRMASGDAVGFEAIGSALTAYRKPSGGSWGSLASRTDSTYTSAGYIALEMQRSSTAHRFDDFGGGTVVAGGSPQSQAITTATETDSAQPVGRRKTRAVTVATSTDSAQALGRRKTRAVTVAAEADAAQALGRVKRAAVAAAAEADTALAIGRRRALLVQAALENDAAAAIARARSVALATETDVAVAVTTRKAATVGVALEVDVALAVSRQKAAAVAAAQETDEAAQLGAAMARAVAAAAEQDEAQPLDRRKTVAIGAAVEGDEAPPVSGSPAFQVTLATETDLALALGRRKTAAVTVAVETDLGLALVRMKARPILPGLEQDEAGAAGRARARAISAAVETDLALELGRGKRAIVLPAVEVDIAVALLSAAIDPAGIVEAIAFVVRPVAASVALVRPFAVATPARPDAAA